MNDFNKPTSPNPGDAVIAREVQLANSIETFKELARAAGIPTVDHLVPVVRETLVRSFNDILGDGSAPTDEQSQGSDSTLLTRDEYASQQDDKERLGEKTNPHFD
jgi:hypothetical protein